VIFADAVPGSQIRHRWLFAAPDRVDSCTRWSQWLLGGRLDRVLLFFDGHYLPWVHSFPLAYNVMRMGRWNTDAAISYQHLAPQYYASPATLSVKILLKLRPTNRHPPGHSSLPLLFSQRNSERASIIHPQVPVCFVRGLASYT